MSLRQWYHGEHGSQGLGSQSICLYHRYLAEDIQALFAARRGGKGKSVGSVAPLLDMCVVLDTFFCAMCLAGSLCMAIMYCLWTLRDMSHICSFDPPFSRQCIGHYGRFPHGIQFELCTILVFLNYSTIITEITITKIVRYDLNMRHACMFYTC